MLLIKNAKIIQSNNSLIGNVLCKDGKIIEISTNPINTDCNTIDAKYNYVTPGFIDIHTHGAVGIDVNNATEADYTKLSKFFASCGTTSYLASVLTDTPDQTMKCLNAIKNYINSKPTINNLRGVHLEGPFLNPKFKGAMPEHLLKEGDMNLLQQYLDTKLVKYLTVSPEIEGVNDIIKKYSKIVSISLGHCAPSYEVAMEAIQNGAKCITHIFNAMEPLDHHNPGILGSAMESDAYCEIICDGRHLNPATVRMLIKVKGLDKLVAITDSIMATGLSDGEYKLGVNDIVVKNGNAVLASNGVRAGSTLTMIDALRNLLDFTKYDITKLIPLLTYNPACVLNIEDTKGTLDIGYDADLVMLSKNFDVVDTIINGEIVN
ncbi:N-acetylglucosamine-6-phosphate deacetylase [Candidatus Epulonipiscium fishelsonii]|nr:N-acetylglucosamine-6-phosphate deacetylase [Epulopiscium sp. SCG-C06WGA-EpuloA1]